MGKLLSYTNEQGVVFVDSYWIPEEVHVRLREDRMRVVMIGWKDKEAKSAKKQPIGTRSFTLAGAACKAVLDQLQDKTLNLKQAAYAVVDAGYDEASALTAIEGPPPPRFFADASNDAD